MLDSLYYVILEFYAYCYIIATKDNNSDSQQWWDYY